MKNKILHVSYILMLLVSYGLNASDSWSSRFTNRYRPLSSPVQTDKPSWLQRFAASWRQPDYPVMPTSEERRDLIEGTLQSSGETARNFSPYAGWSKLRVGSSEEQKRPFLETMEESLTTPTERRSWLLPYRTTPETKYLERQRLKNPEGVRYQTELLRSAEKEAQEQAAQAQERSTWAGNPGWTGVVELPAYKAWAARLQEAREDTEKYGRLMEASDRAAKRGFSRIPTYQ